MLTFFLTFFCGMCAEKVFRLSFVDLLLLWIDQCVPRPFPCGVLVGCSGLFHNGFGTYGHLGSVLPLKVKGYYVVFVQLKGVLKSEHDVMGRGEDEVPCRRGLNIRAFQCFYDCFGFDCSCSFDCVRKYKPQSVIWAGCSYAWCFSPSLNVRFSCWDCFVC